MRKRLSVIAASLLLLVFLVSACGGRYDSRLLGRWVGMTQEVSMLFWNYEFRRGGTGRWHDGRPPADAAFGETQWIVEADTQFFEHSFTWRATGENRLEIKLEGNDEPFVYFYELIDDDNLLLRRDNWVAGFYMERIE